MGTTSKLFRVELTRTYTAYVLAASEEEAEEFKDEIVDTEDFPEDLFVCSEVVHSDKPQGGWDEGSYVYHNDDGNIRLEDIWPKPPAPVFLGFCRQDDGSVPGAICHADVWRHHDGVRCDKGHVEPAWIRFQTDLFEEGP